MVASLSAKNAILDKAVAALLPLRSAHAMALLTSSAAPAMGSKRKLSTMLVTLLWWLSGLVGLDPDAIPRRFSHLFVLVTALLPTLLARLGLARSRIQRTRLEEAEIRIAGNSVASLVVA
eukprot:80134-Prymnesium_polylepis.1